MKKLILFLSSIIVLASCQKKEYASFQKRSTPTYAVAKKQAVAAQPTTEVAEEAMIVQKPLISEFTASTNVNEVPITVTNNAAVIENQKKASDIVVNTAVKIEKKESFKNHVFQKVLEKQLKKSTNDDIKSGWNKLNKTLRWGIILTLGSMVLWLIPIIGWILAPLLAVAGLILLILGLIKQFA